MTLLALVVCKKKKSGEKDSKQKGKKSYVSRDAKSHIPIRVSITLLTLALQERVVGSGREWLLCLFGGYGNYLQKGLVGG